MVARRGYRDGELFRLTLLAPQRKGHLKSALTESF